METCINSLSINKNFKRNGLALQLDATGWIIVVLVIVSVVIGSIFYLRDSAKVATTKLELDQIRGAVMSYQGIRLDSAYPESLSVLIRDDAVSATDALDGLKHGNFLPTSQRWTTSGVLDLWGNEYVIDVSNKIIYSTQGSSDQDKRISVEFQ